MKKMVLVLVLVMAVALVGCGGGSGSGNRNSSGASAGIQVFPLFSGTDLGNGAINLKIGKISELFRKNLPMIVAFRVLRAESLLPDTFNMTYSKADDSLSAKVWVSEGENFALKLVGINGAGAEIYPDYNKVVDDPMLAPWVVINSEGNQRLAGHYDGGGNFSPLPGTRFVRGEILCYEPNTLSLKTYLVFGGSSPEDAENVIVSRRNVMGNIDEEIFPNPMEVWTPIGSFDGVFFLNTKTIVGREIFYLQSWKLWNEESPWILLLNKEDSDTELVLAIVKEEEGIRPAVPADADAVVEVVKTKTARFKSVEFPTGEVVPVTY